MPVSPSKTSARPDDAIRVEVVEVVIRGRDGPRNATTFRRGAGLPNWRWVRRGGVARRLAVGRRFRRRDTAADGREPWAGKRASQGLGAVAPVKPPARPDRSAATSFCDRRGDYPDVSRSARARRDVSVQKGPREDHAPGPSYFGVSLRADAREVTGCRSPPAKPQPGLMTQFGSRSSKS